jgi:SAM-dependent methyltransferase
MSAAADTRVRKSKGVSPQADWSAYAAAYDLLSEYNPAYQDLLGEFEAFLATVGQPRSIYDIGGGTGNYTQIAARACPDAEIRFLEPDPGMFAAAKSKLSGHPNITFENQPFEALKDVGTADLVVCVHALYAMPDQGQRLRDLRRLLRPGGWLFLVDLGRHMDVADWRKYLFSSLRKEKGLIGALHVFWRGREIATQNTAIFKAQKDGVYWTHTSEELASAVAENGFEIVRQKPVYRGYSDLLVCRARA